MGFYESKIKNKNYYVHILIIYEDIMEYYDKLWCINPIICYESYNFRYFLCYFYRT